MPYHDKDNPLLAGLESVTPYSLILPMELYTITPPPEIIENFLPQAGIMGITAFPGVGKSWLAFEIVRAVSLGKPFLNRFPTKQGSCLFIGSDASIFDYARQWSRISRKDEEENILKTVDPEDNAEYNRELEEELKRDWGPDYHLGPFHSSRFLLQSSFMLDSLDEIRKLIRTVQEHKWGPYEDTFSELDEYQGLVRKEGFDVIVLETLSRLTYADQNNNTEMEGVFRNIRFLAEATDAAIILIHHNSKRTEFNDGADWRGAMSQIGALDSWVQLSPSKKDKYTIKAEFKKFRGITPENFAYHMNVDDPYMASLEMIELQDEPPSSLDKVGGLVEEFLTKSPGIKFTLTQITSPIFPQVSDMYGGSRQKVQKGIRKSLDYLIDHPTPMKPRVCRSGGGARGVPCFYWMEKANEEAQEVQAESEVSPSQERGDTPSQSKSASRKVRRSKGQKK